ncbi:Kelch repeat-containing protein [Pseudomonas triticifolii]|uniref:Phage tail protein n=1 Tax=Pseudomonas triticifolii TaxID=2762592 RepID=A0ABR7BKG8_9PSED|nr:kelch repeat-containing protein [Pseudomonas triticifolii]MBC3957676.1 phage tail protein [Pseudomonas triticifolii]
MGASITLAGESLIALKQSKREALKVSRFVLANIPGLDTSLPIDRSAGLPPVDQIMHSVQVTREGYLSPNRVVYSLMLDSSTGDFDFNWIGLETAEQVLLIAAYVPLQQKRREIPPKQFGNNLTRNIILDYNGAQSLTGIQVPASTWQFDFSEKFTQIADQLAQLRLDVDKKVNTADLKSPVSICVDGPVLIYPGSTNTYKITDFHRFSVYKAATNVGTVTVSADTVTLVIPSGAAAGLVTLDVQRDDAKLSIKVPLGSATIQQPTIVSPAPGASGVTFEPTLTISAFTVFPAGFDTHVQTRWQLSRNAAFTDLVFDITSTTQLTSFSISEAGYRLDPSRQYFSRAMQMGSSLSSAWGSASFNTAAVYIRRPLIVSPSDGQQKVMPRLTVTTDAFSVSGGTDDHTQSRWQFSMLADFSSGIIDSGWTTTQLNAFTPTTALANGAQYYVRMKKKGRTLGETEWSPAVRFTTSEQLKGIYTQLNGGATLRFEHSAVPINNKMYVYGGYHTQGASAYYLTDLWVYDVAGNAWAQLTSGFGGRYAHCAAALGGKMYVFGGHGWGNGTGSNYLLDLSVYDPATDTWKALATGPAPRRSATMVAIGSKLYVYGGYNTAYLADLWEYDTATNKWKQLTASPNLRSDHTAVVINDCMYVFGGTRGAGYFNDVSFYNPATNTWTQLGIGSTQRTEHVAVAIGTKMYVFGGMQASSSNDTRFLNDLWVYDVPANTWTQLEAGATRRQHATAVAMSEEMYLFSGTVSLGGTELNDLWRIS